ncbi:MAG: hypothetical protein ABSE73_04740 [Planctomycetota bacterium]
MRLRPERNGQPRRRGVALRQRSVESLLQRKCEIGTRLYGAVRVYGRFNEVGKKEQVQSTQVLQNVEKERRKRYESLPASRSEFQKTYKAERFHCGVVAMTDNKDTNLEDQVASDLPFEAFQESLPADVADKIRFLYHEIKSRLALRDRAVEALLQQECEIQTRLHEVARPSNWIDELAQKERMQLEQERRNIDKERRDVYESAASDLLQVKQDLMDALLEYRKLRRREKAFSYLLYDNTPPRLEGRQASYFLPPLPQYLAPAEQGTNRREDTPAPQRDKAHIREFSDDDDRV